MKTTNEKLERELADIESHVDYMRMIYDQALEDITDNHWLLMYGEKASIEAEKHIKKSSQSIEDFYNAKTKTLRLLTK